MNDGSRIAIIGAGISGLGLGWLFSNSKKYDVTLFEGFSTNGLDAYAYVVDPNHHIFQNEEKLHIDVPFRYHVPNIYYNLTQLCKTIGVSTHKYEQDISLYDNNGDFILGYSTMSILGFSLPKFFFRNFFTKKFYIYGWNFFWFRRESWKHYQEGILIDKSFGDYLDNMGYSEDFVNDFILNYLSLVHTCKYDVLREYPAELLVRFLYDMSAGYGLWQFRYGTKDFAKRLSENLKIQCNTYVKKVNPITRNGKKLIEISFQDGSTELFDHVIFSTQPNVSATIIGNNSLLKEQKELLEKFPVVESSMCIHTNTSIIPDNQYSLSKNTLHNQTNGAVAHKILNFSLPQLEDLKKTVVMSFSFDNIVPNKDDVLHSVIMKRQIHTSDSLKAMSKLRSLQGDHNIWYCGGFMLPTVPLLESGVASACEIVSHFGISIPWEYKPIIGRDKNIKKEEFSFLSSFIFWISIFSVLCFIFIQMCNIVFI